MNQPNKESPSIDRYTILIIAVVVFGVMGTFIGTLLEPAESPNPTKPPENPTILAAKDIRPELIPLATGQEPIEKLFIQAGCASCHTIPGIPGAIGREGPALTLGATGPQRLADPRYQGHATTIHEYILESVLNPGIYVVDGYPDRVMPRWYGQKLSAGALEKITNYLENIKEPS